MDVDDANYVLLISFSRALGFFMFVVFWILGGFIHYAKEKLNTPQTVT